MTIDRRLRPVAAAAVAMLALGLVSADLVEDADAAVVASAAPPSMPATLSRPGIEGSPTASRPEQTTTTAITTSTTPAAPPSTTTATPTPPAPTLPPTTTAAPAPTTTIALPPKPQETLQQRVERAYATGVPEMWREAIEIEITVIEGTTSWAEGGGTIRIARSHAESRFEHLVDVVAHEFGHHVAFEHGTRAYPGAAPEGWPEPPNNPAEAWADCVQQVFTGRANPSHGLGQCSGAQLSWAADWLSTVPEDPQT